MYSSSIVSTYEDLFSFECVLFLHCCCHICLTFPFFFFFSFRFCCILQLIIVYCHFFLVISRFFFLHSHFTINKSISVCFYFENNEKEKLFPVCISTLFFALSLIINNDQPREAKQKRKKRSLLNHVRLL